MRIKVDVEKREELEYHTHIHHGFTFADIVEEISRALNLPMYLLPSREVYCACFSTNEYLKILAAHDGAFQSFVLRVIAVKMDSLYNDNIRNCEYVWIINTLGGKITKIPTKSIRNNSWKYFAAFRSQEEAIEAVKLLKEVKDFYA